MLPPCNVAAKREHLYQVLCFYICDCFGTNFNFILHYRKTGPHILEHMANLHAARIMKNCLLEIFKLDRAGRIFEFLIQFETDAAHALSRITIWSLDGFTFWLIMFFIFCIFILMILCYLQLTNICLYLRFKSFNEYMLHKNISLRSDWKCYRNQ